MIVKINLKCKKTYARFRNPILRVRNDFRKKIQRASYRTYKCDEKGLITGDISTTPKEVGDILSKGTK